MPSNSLHAMLRLYRFLNYLLLNKFLDYLIMAFYVVFVRLLRVVTNAYGRRRLSVPCNHSGNRPPPPSSHRFNPLGSLFGSHGPLGVNGPFGINGPFGVNGPFSLLGSGPTSFRRPTLAPPPPPFDDYDYDLDALDGTNY